MFENFTEEFFLDQAKSLGENLGVDIRQGSIYMDGAVGHCIRAAKFYSDLSSTFELLFIDTCTGEVLNQKVGERNIIRKGAVSSYYNILVQGVELSQLVGERFMVDGYYFVLESYDSGYYIKSEKVGIETNNLLPGQSLIPMKNTKDLKAVTLGEIYLAGADEESDDSLRKRYQELITKATENGNKQQYKIWCEEFEGVGRAIIYPLAYGVNTVKAIIVTPEGIAPTQALVEEIQHYIDPNSEGLGEGVAPIGCIFYAEAAIETVVDISLIVQLVEGYSLKVVKESIISNLEKLFQEVALSSIDKSESGVIQYIKVVSVLANTEGIMDFTQLKLNGSDTNVVIGKDNVGVLGEVVVNVGI